MNKIYEKAEEVVVYLPVSGSITTGFNDWQTWRNWLSQQLQSMAPDASRSLKQDEQPPAARQMIYSNFAVDSYPADSYPVVTPNDKRQADYLTAWSHIHAIIESPWWSRAWIYQEFILANRATFMIDELSAPWKELSNLLNQYHSHIGKHVVHCKTNLQDFRKIEADLSNSSSWHNWLSSCERCSLDCAESAKDSDFNRVIMYSGVNDCEKVCIACGSVMLDVLSCCCSLFASACGKTGARRSEEFRNKVRQKALLIHHMNNIQRVREAWKLPIFIMKAKADWEPHNRESLSSVMRYARNCQSGREVDKIYAFLGLVDNRSYGIVANYNLSTNTVLSNVAKAIIVKERRLDILSMARENTRLTPGNDFLPSWAPDWAVPDYEASEYKQFLKTIEFPVDCRATKSEMPVVSFDCDPLENPDRIMKAKALKVDVLSRIVRDTLSSWKRFRGDSTSLEFVTRSTVKLYDEVWLIYGCNEPFALRKEESYYTILSHAMIWENETESSVLFGEMIDRVSQNEIQPVEISII
jgi:Heterokaryon incompatibility protein (HET)